MREAASLCWRGIWRSLPNINSAPINSKRPNNLGKAEHLVETTEEKDHLAEIIRLRGRLWQAEGHHEQARLCFERAIARSREQEPASWN